MAGGKNAGMGKATTKMLKPSSSSPVTRVSVCPAQQSRVAYLPRPVLAASACLVTLNAWSRSIIALRSAIPPC